MVLYLECRNPKFLFLCPNKIIGVIGVGLYTVTLKIKMCVT